MNQNILLITADQFRYDAMGHCGVFPVQTPHIDALAAGGTSLEAYTPYPMCVPARASIMTGLPAHKHGAYYNGMPWHKNLETLPGVLSENGFHSVIVGKTHFYPERFHGGFDKMHLNSDIRRKIGRKENKKKRSPGEIGRTWDKMIVNHYNQTWPEDQDLESSPGIAFTSHALGELDHLSQTRDCQGGTSEPFFMWLSLLQPHSPCKPPPPYSTMYRPEDLPPPVRNEEEKEFFSWQFRQKSFAWRAVTEESLRAFRARYLGDVSLVDAQVGRMMQKLEELGLRENTLVIFSSDHGEYMGDHHQMQKGSFHECSSRVPLIFNGPGVKAGHRPSGFSTLCDLKPTLLDSCELLMPSHRDSYGKLVFPEWSPAQDAISLVPMLRGGDIPSDRVVYSENGVYGQSMMVRRENLKFNYYPQTQEFDFFDLATDPDELKNRGREVTWESLPAWAHETLSRILTESEYLKQGSYFYDGKVWPMFT